MLKASEDVALELATSNSGAQSAFLINPITLLEHVSLIVNGRVNVYGSRNPAFYQIELPTPTTPVCGAIGPWPTDSGCNPLITLSSHTGIYGNGVIDGQGDRILLRGVNGVNGNYVTWWDLTQGKNGSGAKSSGRLHCHNGVE